MKNIHLAHVNGKIAQTYMKKIFKKKKKKKPQNLKENDDN